MTLDLSASLSILPRPTLQISNLTISKKDKFSIKSQQATVPVSVVTLLSGGLSGSSLTIANPVITLPPSSLPETRQSALALLSGALGAADSLQQTPIDAVAIRSGKIVVAADTQISFVETFDADLSITKSGRIDFDLRLPWKSEAVDVSARVDPVDPKTGSKASSLVIKSAPASISLEGALATTPELHFAGTIDLTIKALDRFGKWLDIDPPINFATPLAVKGAAEITGERIAIREAALTLGKIEMKGGIGLDVAGQRPLVFGSLSAGDMDVTEFLSPLWPKQAQGWKTEPLSNGLTPEQDFDVRFSAERVNLGIVRIANLAVSILAKDRALDLTLGGSKLFQGSAKGKVSIKPED